MICDANEMVNNYEIYAGKLLSAVEFPNKEHSRHRFSTRSVSTPDVNHNVSFDNWFSSLLFVVEQAKRSIFTLGTTCSN